MNKDGHIQPVLWMLAGFIMFFTVVILICVRFFNSDGQTFQLFSGAFNNFVGALLGFVTGVSVGSRINKAGIVMDTTSAMPVDTLNVQTEDKKP